MDKDYAGNDLSYLVVALIELSLQSSIVSSPFVKCGQHFAVNPNLRKAMNGLDIAQIMICILFV
jgi:hypothetical protein